MEVHTQGEASPEENRPQDNSASCTLLENAMVESLLKQDVAARSLSSYRIGADEAPDSSRCRLVISYAGLSKRDARVPRKPYRVHSFRSFPDGKTPRIVANEASSYLKCDFDLAFWYLT